MTPVPDAKGRCCHFGPFRLDAQTRELRAGDVPVELTAKAFDVLLVLLANRDRVVGRDELLSTVWAGRVVEENNLTQAIAALRRAFGTDAHDHRYIVTVPGRGYRFVADVEEDADAPPPAAAARQDAAPSTVAGAPQARPPSPVPAAAGRDRGLRRLVLLLAVALPAAWWTLRGPSSPPPLAAPRSAPQAPAVAPPLTLAVLPFQPLSEGGSDALLGLGLADTLITRISGSTSLRVSPLSSSRHVPDLAQDPADAARRLGVAYVVEGTTQRHGDEVKVNVRLVDAKGAALWSDSFDAPIEGVFTLQDRIAEALAEALAVRVEAVAYRSPCDGADAEAYRAYLSGQYRLERPSAASARQAMADFRRALDLDPTCARAYAAMAQAYRVLVVAGDADPREEFPRARRLVERALSLDPRLPEAHLAQAWIQFWYDWDWAASEVSFRRAIELNPSMADAYFGYAHLLGNTGRAEGAAARARDAMALDPLSPVINAIGGWFVAPPGEAIRYMDRALELDPDYWLALLMRGASRVASGDAAGGLADLDRARALCGDCSHALAIRGLLEMRRGNRDAARGILREMEARDREGYWPATSLATLHNALGETGEALDLLERAWRERDLRMTFLAIDEGMRWSNLRDEPRYRALKARMDLAADDEVRTRTPSSASMSVAGRSSR